MKTVLEELLTKASQVLTLPLFQVGGTSVSLSLILELIVALLIVIFIGRLINNFLKKWLLAKMGIDEGNRKIIARIISYSINILGFVIALDTIGVNLASLAVVAGGLGIGIGFGLENITKNFVSGLTLLVERTIKVGDFVEFEGLEGYVKEISIRSTIIRTKNNGDVVVPNSNLVENRLLNWSYESFVGRIYIPVKVSNESEPVLVTETLLTSAYMEPAVLTEQTPQVIFKGFTENSLDFELRVYVNRIDLKDEIQSNLTFIIEYNLRQQGILLPQNDVWIKNIEQLTTLGLARQNSEDRNIPQLSHEQETKQLPKPLSIRDLLRSVTYFQNLTDLELRKLIEIGHRKRLRADEILFSEGDPGDAFYIILSGSVEVFVEKINKHLNRLQAGQFFGELALMLAIPRTATVKAVEDTILFAIGNDGFRNLLQEQPELAERIIQELGQRKEELASRQQQLRELGLVDAAEDDHNPVDWVRKRIANLFSVCSTLTD